MTAVILAGGKSRRMGRDKLRLSLSGETMLARAVRRFGEAFDRVVVSVGEKGTDDVVSAEWVADVFPGCGPMAGLHAALRYCGEDVFLTAADMPFADPAAARLIAEKCGDADACIMTDESGRPEPLFSFYRIAALPWAEKALREGRRSMRELFADLRIRTVGPDSLGGLWSDRLLVNVNDPAEYERICLELDRDK